MQNLKFLGTGSALPEKVLTNQDLERMVDTSDDWITGRTGIQERRIARDDVSTSDLAAKALSVACENAGMSPSDLDGIILGTSTTDTLFPSTACWVQERLGVRGMFAFDVSAGCSGFLYALEIASALMAAGRGRRFGVIGAEVMSKVVNWNDRGTCVLFGDGAGAAVIGPSDGDSGILASHWGANGSLAPCLYQPAGGTQRPATAVTVAENLHTVHMQGRHVFKHAVEAMASAALSAMDQAKLTADDIDLLIPHQANIRIMEATRQRCGVPSDRMFSVVAKYGNMSAATIPIAIHEAAQAGRLQDGSLLLTTAFGTGFTWAAHAIRW